MSDERREALVTWVNSLPGSSTGTIFSISELYDGIKLGEVLCEMIPGELNPQLIKKDFGDNAIMRANNIKRIVTTVQSFLGNNNVKFSISNKVDPQTIANTKDEDQLELIIQGLLGVAVECPKREEYISTITSLPENCMRQLMLLIDAVINAKDENNSISSQDLSKYTEEISALNAHNTELKQRLNEVSKQRQKYMDDCMILSSEVETANEQKKEWKKERENLTESVKKLEKQLEKSRKREDDLQKNVKSLQNSLQNKDTDSRTITIELQEELKQREDTIGKLRRRVQEMEKENAIVQELRQRVDVLLDAQAEAEQDKKKLTRLRQRMEEMKELKTRFTSLETKYEDILEQNTELSTQVQQQKQTIQTLSSYKTQFTDVSSQLVQLEVDLSVKDNQIRELNNQIETFEQQKNVLRQSNQALEIKTKELSSLLESQDDLGDDSLGETLGNMDDVFTPELKEKMKNLERENQRLKNVMNTADDSTALKAELEQSKTAQQVMQKTIDSLKSELASAKLSKLQEEKIETSNSNEELESLQQQINIFKKENSELQSNIKILEQEKNNLIESSTIKEAELQLIIKETKEKLNEVQSQITNQTDSTNENDDSSKLHELNKKYEELSKTHNETLENLNNVKNQLETSEIENEELAKALEAMDTPSTSTDGNQSESAKIENLKTQIDLLHSSLAALGMRYGGRVAINSANTIERLSLLANKRNATGITY